MKLYTLEYDCNLPTTQQVNVATNTDAKIGIKVKKNGEYLSLDRSTLSVEVGNEIVFAPTTINGTSAELTASTTTTNVTLSADAEPTNGYVTFPITTPDTASYVQDTVVVNKESIVTNCDKNSKMPPATPSINKVFTSDIIPEGMLVSPDVYMQYGSSALSADGERISGYAVAGFRNILIDKATYGAIAGNSGTIDGVATDPNKWYLCKNPTAFVKEWDLEHPLDYIKTTKPSFIQTTWQRIYLDPQPTASDTYMFFHCSWKTEETKATFKLNVNTFKSQQGDKEYIKELPDIPTKTTEFAGTYSDNTPFSFDIFYK